MGAIDFYLKEANKEAQKLVDSVLHGKFFMNMYKIRPFYLFS